MEKIELKGHFRIADYSLTHKVLLLRNNTQIGETFHNVDILFGGTFYIEIATRLNDIVIEIGDEQDMEYIIPRSNGQAILGKVFIIHSGGIKYYVGAGQMEILENSLDILETSIGAKKHLYNPPAR